MINAASLINKMEKEIQLYQNGVQLINYRGPDIENVTMKSTYIVNDECLPLVSLGNGCFDKTNIISSISFNSESQLTEIRSKAFQNSNIIEIELPGCIEKIGKRLIQRSHLKEIKISNGLFFEIRNGIFLRKEKEDSPEMIIFANPDIKSEIQIDNNSIIGIAAFGENYQINKLTLPNSLKVIPSKAFYRSYLSSITISDESLLNTIEENSFERCTRLKSFSCPPSLITIGARAFWGSGLEMLLIPDNSQLENICEAAFMTTKIQEITIPMNVKVIYPLTFKDCHNLNLIRSHDLIKAFGHGCFDGCNINYLNLPQNIECLDDFCFSYNKNLQKLDFSSCQSLRYVSPSSFYRSPINEVIIPTDILDTIKCAINIEEVDITIKNGCCDQLDENLVINFTSKEECINYISKQAILNSKGIKIVENRDHRLNFKCKDKKCNFNIISLINCDSSFFIAKSCNHSENCTSNEPKPLKDHLRSVVRHFYYGGIRINKDLLNKISNNVGMPISSDRLRDTIRSIERDIRPHNTWEMLPDLVKVTIDKGGLAFYKYKRGTTAIKYVAILPEHGKLYLQARCFNGVIIGDGTFSNCAAGGVILVFCTITGNHNIIPICYGWAPTESGKAVMHCLKLIKEASFNKNFAFIVDQGKGLEWGIKHVFGENAEIHICAWHFIDKFSKTVRDLLYRTIDSFDFVDFLNNIKIIEISHPIEFKRIFKQLPKLVRFYFKNPSAGIKSSQAAESLNAELRSIRDSEPIRAFEKLYFIGRKVLASSSTFKTRLVPWLLSKKKELYEKTEKYDVTSIVDDTTYNVLTPTNRTGYQVEYLHGKQIVSCSCMRMSETGYPCSHIISAFKCHSKKPSFDDFVQPYYFSIHYKIILPFPMFYTNLSSFISIPTSHLDMRRRKTRLIPLRQIKRNKVAKRALIRSKST